VSVAEGVFGVVEWSAWDVVDEQVVDGHVERLGESDEGVDADDAAHRNSPGLLIEIPRPGRA
jgi:hypothetical protein